MTVAPQGKTAAPADGAPGIVVACGCGQQFRAPPHLAGKRVKCPACGGPLEVVAQQAPPPAFDPLGDAALWERSTPAAAAPVSHWPAPARPAKPRKPFPTRRVVRIAAIVLLVLVVLAPIAVLVGGAIYGFRRGYLRAQKQNEAFTQSADAPWKEYVSPENDYTIQMPALVLTKTDQVETDSGPSIQRRSAYNRAGEMFYEVEASDIPPANRKSPDMVERCLKAYLAGNPDFKVLSRVENDGYIEVRYESTREGVRWLNLMRCERNESVLFNIEAWAPADKFSEAQARRFIDSFRASKP